MDNNIRIYTKYPVTLEDLYDKDSFYLEILNLFQYDTIDNSINDILNDNVSFSILKNFYFTRNVFTKKELNKLENYNENNINKNFNNIITKTSKIQNSLNLNNEKKIDNFKTYFLSYWSIVKYEHLKNLYDNVFINLNNFNFFKYNYENLKIEPFIQFNDLEVDIGEEVSNIFKEYNISKQDLELRCVEVYQKIVNETKNKMNTKNNRNVFTNIDDYLNKLVDFKFNINSIIYPNIIFIKPKIILDLYSDDITIIETFKEKEQERIIINIKNIIDYNKLYSKCKKKREGEIKITSLLYKNDYISLLIIFPNFQLLQLQYKVKIPLWEDFDRNKYYSYEINYNFLKTIEENKLNDIIQNILYNMKKNIEKEIYNEFLKERQKLAKNSDFMKEI